MTNVEELKRLISEQGMQAAIRLLVSDEISDEVKADLTKKCILVGGYPCLCVLCTLSCNAHYSSY